MLFAVPAEEFVEIEYRIGLVRDGKTGFLTGKQELIRLGHFDDHRPAMTKEEYLLRQNSAFSRVLFDGTE